MPNSTTVPLFANGVAGATALAGVGTTLSGAPVLSYGMQLVTTSAGQVAFALPTSAPASSPVVVANTTATAATVFPGSASQAINGLSDGAAYSIAQNKAVAFYYLGANKWAAVGA